MRGRASPDGEGDPASVGASATRSGGEAPPPAGRRPPPRAGPDSAARASSPGPSDDPGETAQQQPGDREQQTCPSPRTARGPRLSRRFRARPRLRHRFPVRPRLLCHGQDLDQRLTRIGPARRIRHTRAPRSAVRPSPGLPVAARRVRSRGGQRPQRVKLAQFPLRRSTRPAEREDMPERSRQPARAVAMEGGPADSRAPRQCLVADTRTALECPEPGRQPLGLLRLSPHDSPVSPPLGPTRSRLARRPPTADG